MYELKLMLYTLSETKKGATLQIFLKFLAT